ncbi:MAG TPA: ABC transporter permease [Thermoanaerobaculia bacterium]|nr:ABC transporter permease [Thermoanaerobaculia bacterium]
MRWYRLLLRLYPAAFRHEYGDELAGVFRERLRTAGAAGRVALCLGAPLEVFANAARVHWDLLRQDLRQSARGFLRSPAFALTAMMVVALGTGANTAVFSVTDHALFAPLPFPDADRIVKLWDRRPAYSRLELSPANYRDWKERQTTLSAIGAYHRWAANLTGEGDPVRLDGALVEAEVGAVLGVIPTIGRAFREADEQLGAPPVVLLSHRLWQMRFGADPRVLGRSIALDGTHHTVVGVMPRSFLFPHRDVQYWVPLQLSEDSYQDRNDNFLEIVGRLRDEVTLEQATADFERIAAELEDLYPVDNKDAGATVHLLRQEHTRQARTLLFALVGAAVCVLLIACVNLANLLLARALQRRRELMVRSAMGAGRERLSRQLLTETLVLALLGGAFGVGLALWSLPLFSRLVPSTLPIEGRPSIDLRVLLFALALTVATGLVGGLLPVLGLGRAGMTALREDERGGARRERLRSALVVAAVVSSVVLLVSAGLLLRALWRVQSTDPGFRPRGVLTLRISLPQPEYAATERRVQWYRRMVENLDATPGVEDAAFVSFLPMTMTGGIWPVITGENEGNRREAGRVASLRFATPGLFDTLGVPLLQGRDLSWSDTANRPFVAVVSDSFAQRFFPDRSPIGERFELGLAEREIVGVAADVRVRGLERPSEPQVYLPAAQVPDGSLTFYVPQDLAIRTSVEPEMLLGSVREIVRASDPSLPISNVRTLEQIVEDQTASRAVQARVVLAFAGTALLLAAIGIHGLLSFLVSQRRREIGVRVALGAGRGDVLRMVLARSALLAASGVAIGGLLAHLAGRSLEAILAGVPASDPPTLAAVAGICAVMTLLGSLAPAIRALRVDPVTAMRIE